MKDGEPFNPYKLFNGAYIPFSLLESFELSSTAKLLYARLTAYAGEDGFAYPKQKTLAADLGLKTQSNVSHALRQLIDAKFIRVMKPTGKEKLNNKGDKYEFLWNEVLVKSLKNDESTTSKYRSPSIDKSISEDMVYRSCENRNIDTVYKDEKNHIEKNHKEKINKKETSPEPKKEIIPAEEFKLTPELLAWGAEQPTAWTADEMQIHFAYYLDYLENIPIAKRKKSLAAQFRNAVRGNWANIRRANQAKSWQQQNIEATERAKQNFLKMVGGENGNAESNEIDYFD